MSQPSRPRPVPGPPRPGPGPSAGPAASRPGPPPADRPADTGTPSAGAGPFADLEQRPVDEHVAVFEAEHARLQRELATIDQL